MWNFISKIVPAWIHKDRTLEDTDKEIYKHILVILSAHRVNEIADHLYSNILTTTDMELFDNYKDFIEDQEHVFYRKPRGCMYRRLNESFGSLVEFTSNNFINPPDAAGFFHLSYTTQQKENLQSELQSLTNDFLMSYKNFVSISRKPMVGVIIKILTFFALFLIFMLTITIVIRSVTLLYPNLASTNNTEL